MAGGTEPERSLQRNRLCGLQSQTVSADRRSEKAQEHDRQHTSQTGNLFLFCLYAVLLCEAGSCVESLTCWVFHRLLISLQVGEVIASVVTGSATRPPSGETR